MPNKIALPAAEYLTAQQIYRGWALFGIVVFGALLFTLLLAIMVRGTGRPFTFAVIALLCIAGAQVIFWAFTFPTNQATVNWTMLPANWAELRNQWEYSHALSAGLNLVALIAVNLSVLSSPKHEHGR